MAGVDSIAMDPPSPSPARRRARVARPHRAAACDLPDIEDYEALPLAQTSFLYAADGSPDHRAPRRRGPGRAAARARCPRSCATRPSRSRTAASTTTTGSTLQAIAPRRRTSNAERGHGRRGRLHDHAAAREEPLRRATRRRFARKIDEASLAWQLEDRLTKDQILTKYLNTVYFGEGAYGVQAAAQTYFGDRRRRDLTPRAVGDARRADPRAEPLRPVRPHPSRRAGGATSCCALMLEQGMIDARRATAPRVASRSSCAAREVRPALPVPVLRRLLQAMVPRRTRRSARRATTAYKLLFTGGLRITTTLDPRPAGAAQSARFARCSRTRATRRRR